MTGLAIDPGIVGAQSPEEVREVNARDTMNYAAAVGDMNPRYFDDAAASGVVAPPLYAVSATWPVMIGLPEILSGRVDPSIFAMMVHAGEQLTFHRLIRPGERLILRGRVAAVAPAGSGTLLTLRVEAKDSDGKPVFTEYADAMLRQVECKGEGAEAETIPRLTFPNAKDTPLWETPVPVAPAAPYLYDGCANIVFPIHTSQATAQAVGLPGVIVQGTAVLAMAARELVNREGDGDPARLKALACRFSGMVFPGTTISVRLVGRQGPLRAFDVLDGNGKAVLKNGVARIEA
ncbi:MAG: hypothetical protein C4523_19760 [Myxococcales bacterium]|nr:MAG: hypothetical protein C4523_19760 [Myxococcales bacterium]